MGDDYKNTMERTWFDNLSPQKKRKVEVVTPQSAATTTPATTGKAGSTSVCATTSSLSSSSSSSHHPLKKQRMLTTKKKTKCKEQQQEEAKIVVEEATATKKKHQVEAARQQQQQQQEEQVEAAQQQQQQQQVEIAKELKIKQQQEQQDAAKAAAVAVKKNEERKTAWATATAATAPAAQKDEEDKATAILKNHEDAQAAAQTISMDYCPADLIPLSGIMSNDSPLPDIVLSNAKDEIYIMDQPIESFHYKHQASSKSTVRPPITVSCDELQFLRDQQEKMVKDENLEEEVDIDHHYAIDVPDLIIKKKKWDRKIVHNKLNNYFANPDLFFEGKCNGDYPDLKMAADPNDTSGITLLDGSPVSQEIIDNVFLPGEFMSHITPECNLRNSPRDRTRFYDSTEHGALEGGILQHGLKRFTTIEGHKQESHINGVWMLPGSRIKSGIQHVCKNHNNDLMYSNNKVAVVICRKDDPELKKLRPFPLCSTWARKTHPAYSLEDMEVNPEFIFIVHIQNIPQFFDHILGHPDLIDLQTQEQKKETRQKWYQKWYNEGGGKELRQKWYNEGGGKEVRQKYYHEGGGKENQQQYNHQWYHEGGGKEARQKWFQKYYHEGGGKETRQKWYHEGGGKECHHQWYYKGGGKEYKQQYNQQRKLTATEKSFNKFSTCGILPQRLQCDCGKKYNSDSFFQNHIAACPYGKKGGFRSSQQLLIKTLGISATSCKEDHILWLKLRSVWSRVKAMNLPLSVSDFIVNLFNNARQQERVDRLKKMIECEKMRKESAQDKTSIANIESVITEIELQQENNENPPTLVFDDIPSVGYNPKKLVEEIDVPSDKYLRKVLRKNNLPTDGIRTTLLGRLNDHNKSKKPHNYENYW